MTAKLDNTDYAASVEPQLPALVIEVEGKVVTSNAAAYMTAVRRWLADFKTDLKTDEDFVKAAADIKILDGTERALKDAKEKALKDAESLHNLFKLIDDSSEEVRQVRLRLTRDIDAKKVEIRNAVINRAIEAVANNHGEFFRSQIEAAIKGKRSIEAIESAAMEVAERASVLINANRHLLAAHFEAHGNDLIPDRKALELTDTVAQLETELNARIERKRLNDEKRKADAEAAKLRAELAKQQQAAVGSSQAVAAPVSTAMPSATASHPFAEATKAVAPQQAELPQADEWEAFLVTVRAGFSVIKEARAKLAKSENSERAEAFAKKVAVAWKEMIGK